MELDHLCRNKGCCNPEHLEIVTHEENMHRYAATVTHCPAGHPYSPENTYSQQPSARRPWVNRFCRICGRLANKKHRMKKKQVYWDAELAHKWLASQKK
jgi:hypothetical protein